MKNIFENIFKKEAPEKKGPDNLVSKEDYLQMATEPAKEHQEMLAEGKAKKEQRTTKDGDVVEAVVSEDGSILEYTNYSAINEMKQRRQREDMEAKQSMVKQTEEKKKLSNN